jgi:hypothetical protein
LVDVGLLQRGNKYQLSDMGRLVWRADPARNGYGNFCFSHAHAIAIENYSRVSGAKGAEYAVNYRDSVASSAWWVNASVEKAFPAVTSLKSGVTGTATIVKSDNGWKVQKTQEPRSGTAAG